MPLVWEIHEHSICTQIRAEAAQSQMHQFVWALLNHLFPLKPLGVDLCCITCSVDLTPRGRLFLLAQRGCTQKKKREPILLSRTVAMVAIMETRLIAWQQKDDKRLFPCNTEFLTAFFSCRLHFRWYISHSSRGRMLYITGGCWPLTMHVALVLVPL